MEHCILNPKKEKGEPSLPATGILAVNPSDAHFLSDYAAVNGLQRSFLFNSSLYSSNTLFLAGPAVGAPMAVLCLEKLIVLGATRILVYGWCGSLQEDLAAMDVLVPGRGVSEEGTSPHYPVKTDAAVKPASRLRNQLCQQLTARGIRFQEGVLWTTDAPYRETENTVAAYAEQGVSAVDMEYTALCTVAAFRRVELAGVMLVSDELSKTPWKPCYSLKSFKNRSRELLVNLCEMAASGVL